MNPIHLTLDFGGTMPVDKMNWDRPVPILLDHAFTGSPLGVVRLYKAGDHLKGEFHFNEWREDYDLLTPSIGGLTEKNGFTIMCVGVHSGPNKDPRVKAIGVQRKEYATALAKKK